MQHVILACMLDQMLNQKRSFQSKMHQKPSGGRALPGPDGALPRPIHVLGVDETPKEGWKREGNEREGKNGMEK